MNDAQALSVRDLKIIGLLFVIASLSIITMFFYNITMLIYIGILLRGGVAGELPALTESMYYELVYSIVRTITTNAVLIAPLIFPMVLILIKLKDKKVRLIFLASVLLIVVNVIINMYLSFKLSENSEYIVYEFRHRPVHVKYISAMMLRVPTYWIPFLTPELRLLNLSAGISLLLSIAILALGLRGIGKTFEGLSGLQNIVYPFGATILMIILSVFYESLMLLAMLSLFITIVIIGYIFV